MVGDTGINTSAGVIIDNDKYNNQCRDTLAFQLLIQVLPCRDWGAQMQSPTRESNTLQHWAYYELKDALAINHKARRVN